MKPRHLEAVNKRSTKVANLGRLRLVVDPSILEPRRAGTIVFVHSKARAELLVEFQLVKTSDEHGETVEVVGTVNAEAVKKVAATGRFSNPHFEALIRVVYNIVNDYYNQGAKSNDTQVHDEGSDREGVQERQDRPSGEERPA